MSNNHVGYIDPIKFDKVVTKLREFCKSRGFVEAHTQSILSILAACEDPNTLSTFNYAGNVYPLPQTGQMNLEYFILRNPEQPGFFTVSTSYRNEPSPVPGRHDLIFPMFEFELKGNMNDLLEFEKELLLFLGFKEPFYVGNYDEVAEKYDTDDISHRHETQLNTDYGHVFFLKNFPNHTSPFWNMKQSHDGKHARKIDVILHGMETIGSAERSTDKEEMRHMFHTISGGGYASILYSNFNKQRVDAELEDFLSHTFFPRVGGGIGITRMIRAMELSNLI
jgi:aspartyl/asparaginyl-tRNA synthetase